MKKSLKPIAVLLSAIAFGAMSPSASAQVSVTKTTTTTTTTEGATIAEFLPSAGRLVVTSRGGPGPARYSVTKETVFVDEAGAPIAVERITRGVPVTVHYVRDGDRMFASRIVVQQKAAPAKISKAEAKALREYYEKLADELKDPRERAEAKAQHEYYDKLEEELKD